MKFSGIKSALILLIFIFFSLFCKEIKPARNGQKLLVFDDLTFQENPGFDELAKFIAAKPLSENSSLLKITQLKEYRKFAKDVETAWSNFQSKHLGLVDKWTSDHPTADCGENLLYPFSGPDILHAIKFFPDAKTIQMFAQEALGGIPDPHNKKPLKEVEKLYRVLEVIRSSLDYHYFITDFMSGKVGDNEYSGVIGITLFMLGRLDMTVVDIYPVKVNQAGRLEKDNEVEARKADSFAVFFRKPDEANVRVMVYFKGNASDSGLAEKPELTKYLKGLSNYSTLLKAASYLMYEKSFDDMRSQILSHSKCVLSDSSGIPYHYFQNAKWDISMYGIYKGPIKHFKHRFDPTLFEAMKGGGEVLPFDYGYRRDEGMSHMLFFRRKESFLPYEPKYDGSTSTGESTSWNNGQFYRVLEPSSKDIEGQLKYK
jgi:hypothetical protein